MKPSHSMTEEIDLKKKSKKSRYMAKGVPFRVDVFDDHDTPLDEKVTIVKGTIQNLLGIGQLPVEVSEMCGLVSKISGVNIYPRVEEGLSKSDVTVGEFARVMGTTPTSVRRIANRLGSKVEFAKFIKSKLPDIRISHGLTEDAIDELYQQSLEVIKGLTKSDWTLWKSTLDFSEGASDSKIAAMIKEYGFIDSATVGGNLVHREEPPHHLPSPEPIQSTDQEPINPRGFVGGNLALASII